MNNSTLSQPFTDGKRQLEPLTKVGRPPRPLLPHVPERQRGPLMNRFLDPIRTRGILDPTEIVRCVVAGLRQDLHRRGSWNFAADLTPLWDTLLAVLAHPPEALALVREVISYEQLPADEKAKRKETRQTSGRQAYMASQPPTEKRLWCLCRLGVVTVPPNRWDASRLIDGHVRRGVKQ